MNDLMNAIREFYQLIHSWFYSIGNFEGDPIVYVPFAFAVILTMLGIVFFPKPPRPVVVLSVVALAGTHTLYVLFRIFCTVEWGTPFDTLTTLILLFFELVIYVTCATMYFQILFHCDRKPQADRYEQDILSGKFQPTVDVFIPTYSEPVDMLRRTIVGCQFMEYPNKIVHILDDGKRPHVEALAKELGCNYITRQDNHHAKAGNINNALKQTHGEFIVMFDADCVPVKNFLSRMLGFFQESDLGLIISAQAFYNADMFAHNIMSLMEQSVFFRLSQGGRDRFNALLCFGTCFVVRRKAMEGIGGMPTETLSEDWATSIKLQAHGWKTYMLDEPLGAGAVAESMGEFVQQRIRWTQGTLQSLYAPTNPLTIKGLKPAQRFIHLYGILHYLTTPFYILIIIIPLWYFLTGYAPFYVTYGQFWFFFMPFMFFNIITFSWLTQEYTSRLSSLVCESFMCIPISIAIFKTLVRPFGWRFRVTQKGVYRTKTSLNWVIGGPLLLFSGLVILGVIYGYQNRFWYGSVDLFYFLFFFSVLRLILLIIGFYAAHDFPQERKAPRFNQTLPCYFYNGDMITGETVDVSETGVLFKTPHSFFSEHHQDENFQLKGVFSIPQIGFKNIPARLVRSSKAGVSIAFGEIPLKEYRALVQFLFCRPGQWTTLGNLDKKVLAAIVKALKVQNLFTQRTGHAQKVLPGERYFGQPLTANLQKMALMILLSAIFLVGTPQIAAAQIQDQVDDPVLVNMLKKMKEANHELKAMSATINRLKAEYQVNRSLLFPVVDFSLVTGLHHDRQDFRDPQRDDYQLSIPVSYEVDVFRKLQDKAQAANLKSQASQADQDALRISLQYELIERYYLSLAALSQLDILQEQFASQNEEVKDLQSLRQEELVSEDELLESQMRAERLKGEQLIVAQELARLENSLKILEGESPESGWLKGELSAIPWLNKMSMTVSEQDLNLRPDVRSLKLKVQAAEFDRRAVKDESLPSVKLTGDVRNTSEKIRDMTTDNKTGWGVYASVKVPLFDGHQVRSATEAQAAWQQWFQEELATTQLKALEEFRRAEKVIEKKEAMVEIKEHVLELSQKSLKMYTAQYQEGLVDRRKLIQYKQDVYFKQAQLLDARMAAVSARIQLLRAAGTY